MPTIIGLVIFSAVLMAAGDLLASAGKPGRRSGRRTGRAGSGKGAPHLPGSAAAGKPPEGKPAAGAPPDGLTSEDGTQAPEGNDAAGGRGDRDNAGETRTGDRDGEGGRAGRAGGEGGEDGEDGEDGEGGEDGRKCSAGEAGDGGGPPEFPEAPVWGFPSDSWLLDSIWAVAEKRIRGKAVDRPAAARGWDLLRGLIRASRGPDDPSVWACMTRAALSISGKPGCLEAAAALASGACEIMRRMPEDRAGGGEGNTDAGPPARRRAAERGARASSRRLAAPRRTGTTAGRGA
ncbi:MAG: hypothetical protein LBT40_04750 [Deltaproteobacteria bacterium]|nr:hypothetical protein [Deltaproteobacteria bacterium]